jgi:PAS domain S-box-containing protein
LDRYTELFDFAPVGYLTLDDSGRIIEINLTGASMLGMERGCVIDKPLIYYITSRRLFNNYLDQVLNFAENVILEVQIMRPEGSFLDVQLESRVSISDGVHPLHIRMIMTDVSNRKSLERQLQQQRVETESLIKQQVAIQTASAIAHDLNQPLAAISAFSEVALRYLNQEKALTAQLQRALTGCVEQAQKAGFCLHELLGFLQKRDLVKEPINLNRLIQDVLMIIQHDKFSDFYPELRLEANLPPVMANPLQVKKVLQNLLCNSLEAMKNDNFNADGIFIKVSTRAEWAMAQVTVQDSGPGLDADTAKRIFEPFFTTKLNGSGLGLIISRSLIEANGGQLWLEPCVDRGAIFHFTLPFAPPA